MRYVIGAVGIVYALLSMFAASVQMRKAERRDTSLMMLGGGLFFVIGAVMDMILIEYGWCVAAVGGALICIAAFLNGKRGGEFHASHHVIRLALTILLVVGYAL